MALRFVVGGGVGGIRGVELGADGEEVALVAPGGYYVFCHCCWQSSSRCSKSSQRPEAFVGMRHFAFYSPGLVAPRIRVDVRGSMLWNVSRLGQPGIIRDGQVVMYINAD